MIFTGCPHCGSSQRGQPGTPRLFPGGERLAVIAPQELTCPKCGGAVATGAREWVDMSWQERLVAWLEYLAFGGLVLGPVVGYVGAYLLATDVPQLRLAVLLWSVCVVFVQAEFIAGVVASRRRVARPADDAGPHPPPGI